ncbi:MAG: hypothetical protein M0R51_08195 [Clostridia bacterium]|jgi:hypothetical protein|nr:hypothetical protein [Clostridia bacterium]
MTQVARNTLLRYKNEINFSTTTNLPMSQGEAIRTVIATYKIPAIKWGYGGSLIGVETKNQIMIWRDKGHELEFKGLINKTDMDLTVKKTSAKKKVRK